MPSDRPFTKDCDRCGQKIGFRKEGGRTIPINGDGTPHHCSSPGPAAAPKEDSRIGTYGGIVRGRINLTLKNGSIMVTEATTDLLKCLTDPNATVKAGMKIKVVFGKDGKAEKTEICPDQPAPAAAAAPENPTETCTSPKETPETPAPAEKPAERKFTSGDIYSPKDRLIVTQCLLKCWTDLWCNTNTPDSVTFEEAREDILAAVEKDLQRVMNAGSA